MADDKLITTEGCFSCRINGRHRRNSKYHKLRHIEAANATDLWHQLLKRSSKSRRMKRHHHGEELELTISLAQTRHRTRIIKVQPSVKVRKINIIFQVTLWRHVRLIVNRVYYGFLHCKCLQTNMTYVIVKGNEDNKLELIKQHAIWALHFRRRLKQPSVFDLVIHGRPADSLDKRSSENDVYEKPLVLRVKIIVTE